MMYYLLTIVFTAVLVWFGTLICFYWYIEINSEKNKGTLINGKTYYFMTQDQIQNAVKAVMKMEFKEPVEKGICIGCITDSVDINVKTRLCLNCTAENIND